MEGPRPARGLRVRRRIEVQDEDVETTIETRRVPARPGTTETGRPSPSDLGRAERDQMEAIRGGEQPPEEEGPPRQGPAAEEHGRMDRKELTGQQAQDEYRTDGDETDTQGGQRKQRGRDIQQTGRH